MKNYYLYCSLRLFYCSSLSAVQAVNNCRQYKLEKSGLVTTWYLVMTPMMIITNSISTCKGPRSSINLSWRFGPANCHILGQYISDYRNDEVLTTWQWSMTIDFPLGIWMKKWIYRSKRSIAVCFEAFE